MINIIFTYLLYIDIFKSCNLYYNGRMLIISYDDVKYPKYTVYNYRNSTAFYDNYVFSKYGNKITPLYKNHNRYNIC